MMRQHTRRIGWVAAILTITVFCLLGRWQWQRMEQKQALLDQQVPARAQTLALAPALAAPPRLRWVEDHGQFLAGTVLLDNQMREGRAGVKVYQPFRSDGGAVVLVDLGWLPMPPDRTVPVISPREGPAQLAGLLAPPPAPGLAVGPAMTATAQPGVWLASRMPPQEVASVLKLEAVLPYSVLRLDPALPGGYARDLELLPNTMPPSRHLGYAVQWFGLALTVLVVALVLEWRRQRQPGKPGSTDHDPRPRHEPPPARDPRPRHEPPPGHDPRPRHEPPSGHDPRPRHEPPPGHDPRPRHEPPPGHEPRPGHDPPPRHDP